MRYRSLSICIAGGLLLGGLASCDGPTDPIGSEDLVTLAVQASTSGSEMVKVIAIEVTGAGIPVPIIVNLEVVNGSASGTVTVPPGTDRTFTGRGFDAQANITHEGAVVTDVRPGQATVRIPMFPRGVGVPIEVTVGAYLVSVAPETADLEVGAQLRFTATVTDADGVTIDNPDLTWGSSNPAFATVDGEGEVTGVYPGTARIVVSFNGVAAEAVVTVGEATEPVITRVEVTPAAAEIQGVGETTQLTAEAFDADDDPVADADFIWETSDRDVATVDEAGLVTAVAAGEATITAYAGAVNGTAAIEVTVEARVATSIIVTPGTATASRGETEQFTATVYDQFGDVMPGIEVAWTSRHPCLASVDADGLATAISGGSATIVASAGGLTGTGALAVPHGPAGPPASFQGDWLVCTISDGAIRLTLHLEHEEGATEVTGSVTMANGYTTGLAPSTWQSGFLTVSWSISAGGDTRNFIIRAEPQSEVLLTGRYTDGVFVQTYDVRVMRVLD